MKQEIPDGYEVQQPLEKDRDKGIKVSRGFQIEPLRLRVVNILRQRDQSLSIALGQNITSDYHQYIEDSLERNENILLSGAGRTRSGKSLAFLEQGLMISEHTGISFDIPHIAFHYARFMSMVRAAKFKEWYHIDESEESRYQMGAAAEDSYAMDFDRICAKKCINRVVIVGDYSTANQGSSYKLITLARDFHARTTRFILYSVENHDNIPLGVVDIKLRRILCDDMKNNLGFSCIRCDKYKTCQHFLARYEKHKDANIARISDGGIGGVASERTMERAKLAKAIAASEGFKSCRNIDERVMYVRMNYPTLGVSNRTLTEGEVKEVANWAGYLRREEQSIEKEMTPRSGAILDGMTPVFSEDDDDEKPKKKQKRIRKELTE